MKRLALVVVLACHAPVTSTSSPDHGDEGPWLVSDASPISNWTAWQDDNLMLVAADASIWTYDTSNIRFEDATDAGYVVIASRTDGGPWVCGACASPRREQLRAWLTSRPLHRNAGRPIDRTAEVVDAIVNVVEGEIEDYRWAATLDTMAAYETGYRPDICGGCPGIANGTPCTREQGAESCGAWATEVGRTSRSATVTDQARVALKMLKESESWCPTHPLAMYGGVGHRTPDGVWHPECRAHTLTDFRLKQINRELGRTP
jgi:hypothetical protein